MWSIIANIAISAAVSIAGAWGVYHYAPLSFLEGAQRPVFGSTITTINGSDTLSNSRTTINNNFTNLNAGKVEDATTSMSSLTTLGNLITVGTLTSGALGSGFTAVTVPQGGTGSTTLSSGQLLLGNGAGNIGVVSGYGSAQQILTSNGTGIAPTWQSGGVDQTLNYLWTGIQNFIGNTYIKNLNASSTEVIGGVTLVYPASQGGVGTFLKNNGSGTLSWNVPDVQLLISTTTSQAMATASTTFNPTGYNNLKIVLVLQGWGSGSAIPCMDKVNGDAASDYGSSNTQDGMPAVKESAVNRIMIDDQIGTTSPLYETIYVQNISGNRKQFTWVANEQKTAAQAPVSISGAGVWNNTSSQLVNFQIEDCNASSNLTGSSIISVYGY